MEQSPIGAFARRYLEIKGKTDRVEALLPRQRARPWTLINVGGSGGSHVPARRWLATRPVPRQTDGNMTDTLALIAIVACWGAVITLWIGGALYNAANRARPRLRDRPRPPGIVIAVFLTCVIVAIVGQAVAPDLVVDVLWLRLVGLVLLVAATMFAIWARLALGTSWSMAPAIVGDRRLRTTGPYGVTRHPIYSGILGMALGSALLGGFGVWVVIVAIIGIAFAAKIRMEEALLLATFPDEYPAYRERVPQLVPSLNLLRRRSVGA